MDLFQAPGLPDAGVRFLGSWKVPVPCAKNEPELVLADLAGASVARADRTSSTDCSGT